MTKPKFYLVGATLFTEQEKIEQEKTPETFQAFAAKAYEEMVAETWPRLRVEILNAIQQHDSNAFIGEVNDKRSRVVMISTGSKPLLKTLKELHKYMVLHEMPNGTTLEQMRTYHQNLLKSADSKPAMPQTPPTPSNDSRLIS